MESQGVFVQPNFGHWCIDSLLGWQPKSASTGLIADSWCRQLLFVKRGRGKPSRPFQETWKTGATAWKDSQNRLQRKSRIRKRIAGRYSIYEFISDRLLMATDQGCDALPKPINGEALKLSLVLWLFLTEKFKKHWAAYYEPCQSTSFRQSLPQQKESGINAFRFYESAMSRPQAKSTLPYMQNYFSVNW